jgi:peptidoglycan/xylan/chitin deacetylase (PgdA/CDA1 family)
LNSFLIISLDFELHWGRFDKIPLAGALDYYREARRAIPKMLELFEQNGIHATWATVGSLMAENEEEWRHYAPELRPSYYATKYSAYHWFDSEEKIYEEALFAPDLVRQVIACPYQEIGSHTFSHYYTCEAGQNGEEFRSDLQAAKKIAKEKFGLGLHSLVFPRNQVDFPSLDIVREEGFKTARTNPNDWYWRNTHRENLIKRLFRTGDTLVALGEKTSYTMPPKNEDGFLALPASRLLRPYRKTSLFNQKRINRIKEEMEMAARLGEVYHLWWHPHNFGHFPGENLHGLETVLRHFKRLEGEYGMASRGMGGVMSGE